MKRQFSSQMLHELSFHVLNKLLRHPRLKEAKTIMLYYSLSDEVDTHTIIDSLLLSKKRILLPEVTGAGTMRLREYTGPCDLRQGVYGIMEPTGNIFTDLDSIDLAIVPGMAFDHSGNRMGRGKGYYDRFLPQLRNAYKIGICFDFQVMEALPTDEHDISMNEVLF